MSTLKELNQQVSLADQLQSNEDGSIVLFNIFSVSRGDEDAMISKWSSDAAFMRAQPGYISTQLHRAIGESPTFLNYAIWESVESFRNAFSNPDFQAKLSDYPESTQFSPHLFKKLAVTGFCVA